VPRPRESVANSAALAVALLAALSAGFVLATPAHAQNLTVNGGSQSLGGTHSYSNVTITGGGTLYVVAYNGSPSSTGLLTLNVSGTFTLDAGSSINGDSRGYRGQTNGNGEGPGGGSGGAGWPDGGGGGGYGGTGGHGTHDNGSLSGGGPGGPAYGSTSSQGSIEMGSAGGAAGNGDSDYGGYGGYGGAAVWIDASTVVLNGTISMNGGAGDVFNNDAAGGGAGGGILIVADTISMGSGALLRANGACGGNVDDDGGGGAGGRIKIFYGGGSTGGTLQVSGGCGPDGATDGDPGTTWVEDVNQDPSAVAGGPYSGGEGAAIALSGAGSNDPDGSIVSYSWDCSSDGVYDVTTASATGGTCSYPDQGTYTATLQVTDNAGAVDTAAASVSVSNVAPTITTLSGGGGDEAASLGFSAAATDPAGAADPIAYSWDWGDGSPAGSGASVSHAWADDGSYTVTVTADDGDGGSDSESLVIAISNVAPSITSLSVPAGVEADAIPMTASGSDPAGASDPLVFTWDFGDGTPTGTGPSLSHAYADDGSYTVTVTVDDGDGGSDVETATAVVSNANPSVTSATIPGGDEGEILSFGASGSDPAGPNDPLSFAWDFGDGTPTASGAAVTHAYADDGDFTVTVLATDGDGGWDSYSGTASISNVPPQIDSVLGPISLLEGELGEFEALVSDAGTADILVVSWGWGDGAPLDEGEQASHAWSQDGSYEITVTVTDDDGDSSTATVIVSIGNDDPLLESLELGSGDEGSPIAFSATASDPGDDFLTFSWDFGDGSLPESGDSVTHVYADEGGYTVTVTVSDGDGGSDVLFGVADVWNAAPSVVAITGPALLDEGAVGTFEAVGDDPGAADLPELSWSWDWGDGTPDDSGSPAAHAFPDDGVFTLEATVSDADGGAGSAGAVVTVLNVAPEIVSLPGFVAYEGSPYVYQPVVEDPGAEVFAFVLSPAAPASMSVDGASGELSWTPSFADSLAGPYPVTLTVDDGDGGSDAQSWVIAVESADEDGDGLVDGWEEENGVGDPGGDPDGDGLDNLEEFEGGTDPNVYDGPSAPLPISPVGGVEVGSDTPDLAVLDATDPGGDPLTYEYEVWAEEALATLLATAAGEPDGIGPESSWKVEPPLPENALVFWRARADDGNVSGPWSALESFFVNALNEPPPAPVAVFPVDDQVVAVEEPWAEWAPVGDPDGDDVTYQVRLWDEAHEELLAEEAEIEDLFASPGRDPTLTWVLPVALWEDVRYTWDAAATDEHGLQGAFCEPEPFFFTLVDGAPGQPFFVDPLDGDTVDDLSPALVATEVSDPEGLSVEYEFDVDLEASFDTAQHHAGTVPASGNGEVVWDLGAAAVILPENTWIWARVRAVDGSGIESPPDVIQFWMRGNNQAPPVPPLLLPEDGAPLDEGFPVLVCGNVQDPEGDLVFYEFRVSRDPQGTDVVSGRGGLLGGSGEAGSDAATSWRVDRALDGEYFWTARALDEAGAASAWAPAWRMTATVADPEPAPEIERVWVAGGGLWGGGGCGAELAGPSRAGGGLVGGLLLLLMGVKTSHLTHSARRSAAGRRGSRLAT
jgi:PKD repeat protein